MERKTTRLPHPLPGTTGEVEVRTPEEMERWGRWLVTSSYCASTDEEFKARLLRDNPWLGEKLREAGR